MSHSTTKPTKAQKRRMDAVAAMPCIACEIEKCCQPNRTEVHHCTDKGYRSHSGGHDATLNLCSWHHRGICIDGVKEADMAYYCGPSLALHKRRFIETYGTERELLARIDERLMDQGVIPFPPVAAERA